MEQTADKRRLFVLATALVLLAAAVDGASVPDPDASTYRRQQHQQQPFFGTSFRSSKAYPPSGAVPNPRETTASASANPNAGVGDGGSGSAAQAPAGSGQQQRPGEHVVVLSSDMTEDGRLQTSSSQLRPPYTILYQDGLKVTVVDRPFPMTSSQMPPSSPFLTPQQYLQELQMRQLLQQQQQQLLLSQQQDPFMRPFPAVPYTPAGYWNQLTAVPATASQYIPPWYAQQHSTGNQYPNLLPYRQQMPFGSFGVVGSSPYTSISDALQQQQRQLLLQQLQQQQQQQQAAIWAAAAAQQGGSNAGAGLPFLGTPAFPAVGETPATPAGTTAAAYPFFPAIAAPSPTAIGGQNTQLAAAQLLQQLQQSGFYPAAAAAATPATTIFGITPGSNYGGLQTGATPSQPQTLPPSILQSAGTNNPFYPVNNQQYASVLQQLQQQGGNFLDGGVPNPFASNPQAPGRYPFVLFPNNNQQGPQSVGNAGFPGNPFSGQSILGIAGYNPSSQAAGQTVSGIGGGQDGSIDLSITPASETGVQDVIHSFVYPSQQQFHNSMGNRYPYFRASPFPGHRGQPGMVNQWRPSPHHPSSMSSLFGESNSDGYQGYGSSAHYPKWMSNGLDASPDGYQVPLGVPGNPQQSQLHSFHNFGHAGNNQNNRANHRLLSFFKK